MDGARAARSPGLRLAVVSGWGAPAACRTAGGPPEGARGDTRRRVPSHPRVTPGPRSTPGSHNRRHLRITRRA
jgi:hypothetical protein